MSSLESDLFHC